MNKKSKIKNIFRIIVLIIILGIFAMTLIYLFNKSRQKPVTFKTETAFVTNIIKKTVATGSVIPRKEIEIKPQVSGIIEELFVEAGKKVHTGDVIARVRIIPDLVNLNNAEARLERAKIA